MEYSDIKETINSPIVTGIKEEFDAISNLYSDKDGINARSMETAKKVLSKFYSGMKTATFATNGSKDEYSTIKYQINKKNLGEVRYYRHKILPFEKITGFFMLLKKKDFRDGLRKAEKKEGKKVLDFLMGLNNKYTLPENNNRSYNREFIKFNTVEEEREAFLLGDEAYILIDDNNIYVSNKKDTWNPTGLINSERENNHLKEPRILESIFTIKHQDEIRLLMSTYRDKLNKEYGDWEKFREEFNGELSKYVLLDMMCGKKK
jgi:hypothetical protein